MTSITEKLELLGGVAKYDVHTSKQRGHFTAPLGGIYPSIGSDGKVICLFKILMTNRCHFDCKYCVNRYSRSQRRESFTPEELASSFMKLHETGLVKGLFLSSGLGGDPVKTMDDMLEAVRLLRFKYRFKGYIHLKVLPGATQSQVKEACMLANRVSVNQEAPTPSHLSEIASQKEFRVDIVRRQLWIRDFLAKLGRGGQSTQYVVGAAGESDEELLKTAWKCYKELKMKRVYYSAFIPIPRTPLEDHPPTPKLREVRLYQADFLLRGYGFSLKELREVFDDNGMLPLSLDPKLAYAHRHPELYPVDVNEAEFQELIRIPGIGVKTAQRILKLREKRVKVGSWKQLAMLGANIKRAAPFVVIEGRSQPSLLSFTQ